MLVADIQHIRMKAPLLGFSEYIISGAITLSVSCGLAYKEDLKIARVF